MCRLLRLVNNLCSPQFKQLRLLNFRDNSCLTSQLEIVENFFWEIGNLLYGKPRNSVLCKNNEKFNFWFSLPRYPRDKTASNGSRGCLGGWLQVELNHTYNVNLSLICLILVEWSGFEKVNFHKECMGLLGVLPQFLEANTSLISHENSFQSLEWVCRVAFSKQSCMLNDEKCKEWRQHQSAYTLDVPDWPIHFLLHVCHHSLHLRNLRHHQSWRYLYNHQPGRNLSMLKGHYHGWS